MSIEEYNKILEEKFIAEYERHEEEILDTIDIKVIESYLRKKKLERIQNEKK